MAAKKLIPRADAGLPPEADDGFGGGGGWEDEPEETTVRPARSTGRATQQTRRPQPPADPIYDPTEGQGIRNGAPIDEQVYSIPVFGSAVQAGELARIRVESMGPDGTYVYEGTLPPNASEQQLITKWKRPGMFKLIPIDVNNNPVGPAKMINVSETNDVLMQVRGTFGGGAGQVQNQNGYMMGGHSGNDPQVYSVIENFMKLQREEREQMAMQMQNERMHAEQMKRDAEEKMAAATLMIAERSANMTDTIVAQQAELARRSQEATMQSAQNMYATLEAQNATFMERMMMASKMAEQEAAARTEADRRRADADLARLKAEADIARQRMQDELAAERERAKLRIEEERMALKERSDRERLDMEERERLRIENNMKLEAERDRIRQEDADRQRKHDEMMEKHRAEARADERERREAIEKIRDQKENPLGATIAMATTIFGAATKLGFDPVEIIQGAMTKTTSGWTDLIKEGVGLVKEVVKTVNHSNGVMPDDDDEDDEDPNAMVQVPMTDGSTRMITRAQLAALQAAQAQKAPPGPPPQIQPPPPPQLAGPQWAADPGMDPAMAVAMGQTTQFYPQHSMGQTLQPAAPGSMYPVQAQQVQGYGGQVGYPSQQPPQQPQFQAPPPPAAYDLGAMKQACVRFVEQLEAIPTETWQAAFVSWVMSTGIEPVSHYMKAVSIRGALREAGATAKMIEDVVNMVDSSGMIPMDIPRG